MFDLADRVAIVTGGNGGIGFGMARGLARAGARVVVAARNEEKSSTAVRELKSLGSDALAIAVDVADERSVDALVGETVKRCGEAEIGFLASPEAAPTILKAGLTPIAGR